MAELLALQRPVSAKELIRRASFSFLPTWELITSFGIAKDEQKTIWHAGHTNDALPLDSGRLLLASATGGVWLAFPDDSSPTVPLSNGWPSVDMRCLGQGTRGSRHFYAAGDGGALFETDTQSLRSVGLFLKSNSARDIAAKLNIKPPISMRDILQSSDAPIFDWKQIAFVGPNGESLGQPPINRLVSVPGLRPAKLVLATDNGLFWSDVPAFAADYRFERADGAPNTRCWGVTVTADNTVIASPTGDPRRSGLNGIYFGTWQSGRLVMQRAAHLGDIDFVKWNDTVVASSAGNRSFLYAAVSDTGVHLSLRRAFRRNDISTPPLSVRLLAQKANISSPISVLKLVSGSDAIYAVLHSDDNGKTWSPVGPHGRVDESVQFTRYPGFYQYATWCIAVSPANTNIIAIGTRTGPVIGRRTPEAFVWEDHGNEDAPPDARSSHLHGDLHGLQFDPHDPKGNTLYVCSDGGVVFTKDLCRTFSSSINRTLPNLQFQSNPARPYASPFASAFPGASGASLNTPGLVAGPLQDNGVVFSFVLAGAPKPWQRQTAEDDGLLGVFLEGDLLLFWNNDNGTARVAKWTGTQFGPETNVQVRTPSPRVPTGSTFSQPFAEPVLRPAFRRSDTNQLMIAIAAYDANSPFRDLWGLFTDQDGGNPVWDFLASASLGFGDSVTAAASDDGFTVLVGTQNGKIFSLDVRSGVVSAMRFDPLASVPPGQIYQFVFLTGGSAIARYQNGLLHFEPTSQNWTAIEGNGLPSNEGSLYFMAVDTARAPNILYVATDKGIHASWDAGANWLPVSQGLPVQSHPSTLRFVEVPKGNPVLYLFTFGRSAWRANLN